MNKFFYVLLLLAFGCSNAPVVAKKTEILQNSFYISFTTEKKFTKDLYLVKAQRGKEREQVPDYEGELASLTIENRAKNVSKELFKLAEKNCQTMHKNFYRTRNYFGGDHHNATDLQKPNFIFVEYECLTDEEIEARKAKDKEKSSQMK